MWMDYLVKEKSSVRKMWTNLCKEFERNPFFVRMENLWDLLFQLMIHGTNTLHVVFLFFFRIDYPFTNCTFIHSLCDLVYGESVDWTSYIAVCLFFLHMFYLIGHLHLVCSTKSSVVCRVLKHRGCWIIEWKTVVACFDEFHLSSPTLKQGPIQMRHLSGPALVLWLTWQAPLQVLATE